MFSRLADRLSAARQRQFVGRATEQAIFQSALTAAELPFFVFYIFGPGGVGKTTLLNRFVHLCEQAQIPAIHLDVRDLDPAPACFLQALQRVMGLPPADSPVQILATRSERHVILIDTFERFKPIEDWFRHDFFPQLSENVLVIMADRHPPSSGWRVDPGWQPFIRTLPLRNLDPEESLAYLAKRSVPADKHQAILNFTYGHPLALSLVADTFAQRDDVDFKPETARDIIRTLLEQLVQKVPSPAHRAALEACALVRTMTEPLLATMLAMTDAHELFEWLRGLSCIEFGSFGLFPHDLARETLATDLHWRNPDWYTELHRRARNYYSTHLQQVQGQQQQAVLIDYIFLHRDNPVVRPFFVQLQSQGEDEHVSLMVELAQESDWPALKQMIIQHEGEGAARLAGQWFRSQAGEFLVLRDADQQPVGVLALVALHRAGVEEIKADPATQAAWHYLNSHAPLRPNERATYFRFWLAHDTYQAVSTIQSLIFVNMVRHYLTTPGLAFSFLPCAQPDFWQPVFTYADLARLPEADFTVAGRHFGVYGHDWRAVPPTAWLELLADRETTLNLRLTPPPQTITPVAILSQSDFAIAVHEALRDFRAASPSGLHHNPLLWSRLVTERAGTNADEARRAATLKDLINEAAEELQATPRQTKLYKALYHTYLHPAPTQETAAELLNLPFSTFRRHLKAGINQVTESLWQQEIGGFKK